MSGTDSAGRDWTRVFLVLFCVAAAVAAGMLVPGLGSDGIAGSPLDRVFPGDAFPDGNSAAGGSSDGLGEFASGGSGLGALNPGDSTGVGGEIGLDNGTFGSNDTEVHFRVESSQPAYWRTGAYSTYTGSGWEGTGQRRPSDGEIEQQGPTGERISYEIQLERPASAVPTAWRPSSVSGVDSLEVTDSGAVRTTETLEPGTKVTAVSHAPARDLDLLRAAGQDYPEEIERRYTQLPEDTPDRIGEFTADLTADDDNPYDTAMSVQQWLRTDKEYSLEASHEGAQIADTFIFEMERGYCEYFATGMVAMLRSQDIPARYVVGYSTGQPTGENSYEVRGMNAHAWVEVYFDGVGWVKFDPTPGNDRLAAQQEQLEAEGESYNPEETGSPGETFEPGEIERDQQLEESLAEGAPGEGETDEQTGGDDPTDGTDTDDPTDGTDTDDPTDGTDTDDPTDVTDTDDEPAENETNGGDEPPAYDISLDGAPVPGATVEVTVTQDGVPAPGREVQFNGDPVGKTDEEGTVTGTVPFEAELRVTVGPSTSDRTTFGASNHAGGVLTSPGTVPDSWAGTTALADEQSEEVYPVETNASVSIVGDIFAGEEVTVVATIEDVAVAEADVLLDGERVGRTDAEGRATVRLPERAGNATIGVERGPVSGLRTVEIPALSVSVDTGIVALPYTSVTVAASAGDRAAVDVPVFIDGEQVATTGPDGTATVRLPATGATIAVERGGMRAETTVSGLLWNLLAVVGAVAALVGATLLVAWRRGYSPRDLFRIARRIPGLVVQYTHWLLITFVTRGDEWLRRVLVRIRLTVSHLLGVARGRMSPAQLWAALKTWLGARRRALADALGRTSGVAASEGHSTDRVPEAQISVRDAWVRFLQCVSVAPHRAMTFTPGELATHAIEHDRLPAEAVVVLRDVFREVEYGSRSASDRLERVESAVERIERASREQDGQPSSDHVTGGRAD